MTIPVWCFIQNENYRVEITQKGLSSFPTERELEQLADDLNNVFQDHESWKGTRAEVQFDEIVRCKLCGCLYEPFYDEDRKDLVCNGCGGGKLELSLKILAGSKGVTTDENILS